MSHSRHDGVAVIEPGQTYVGQQGFTYGAGASADTVGAQKICMNVLPMPPGAVAKAHYHKGIETIAYMLEGECAVYYGSELQRRVLVRQGEQAFVAIDVPHAPRIGQRSGWHCPLAGFGRKVSASDERVMCVHALTRFRAFRADCRRQDNHTLSERKLARFNDRCRRSNRDRLTE